MGCLHRFDKVSSAKIDLVGVSKRRFVVLNIIMQKLNLTVFIFFLIAGCSNGQDSLTLLKDSWIKLKTQLQRRNDIALSLIVENNKLDSADKISVERVISGVSEFNRFIDSTSNLDSLTVRLTKQKADESRGFISKALNLRMKHSEINEKEFRDLQSKLEEAESRIHAAKTDFNKLCNQYKRMDLLFDKS